MQNWPSADFTYIDVEYFRSKPENDLLRRWDYLVVEAVFVSEHTVQFFDHYVGKYKSQRSELDEYLKRLGTDGWKLTMTGKFEGKLYQLRRYQLRRSLE